MVQTIIISIGRWTLLSLINDMIDIIFAKVMTMLLFLTELATNMILLFTYAPPWCRDNEDEKLQQRDAPSSAKLMLKPIGRW